MFSCPESSFLKLNIFIIDFIKKTHWGHVLSSRTGLSHFMRLFLIAQSRNAEYAEVFSCFTQLLRFFVKV